MSAVVQQALIWAALIAASMTGTSAMFVYSCWRAAEGSLALSEPNGYGWRGHGIKIPSTVRSEAAWLVGNRAAARTAPMYALFNLALAAALGWVGAHGWRVAVGFIGGGGFFLWICLLIWTSIVAGRAARAAPDDKATHRPAVRVPTPAGVAAAPPGRAVTAFGWICAVAACGGILYLLGTIVDGYVLAIHFGLQPNSTFGFRSELSFSCLPRWYAAQQAGFTWMLFGYGTVVATSLVLCVGAAIKRRSPWDICLLLLGTVFVSIIFLVAAGIHADRVARAVTC